MAEDKQQEKKKSHVPRRTGVMKKQLGYLRDFTDPNTPKVTIPTLPYEAFDCSDSLCDEHRKATCLVQDPHIKVKCQGEKILPWSLMKLFDSCELNDFWPNQNDNNQSDYDRVMYMLNFEMEVDRTLYDWNSPKFPLVIENRVLFVKRASRAIESVLFHPHQSRPYARSSGIDVNMDPVTRKPKPFPEWWKEHFHFPSEGEKREFKLPSKPNDHVFVSSLRVTFSDTDENKHVNYTSYVRYCFDHMCENILAGKYGADLDVYEIGLKTLQITYLKECNLGDTLIVKSWQDTTSNENTFCFEMWNGSELAASVLMTLYNLLDENNQSRL